MTSFYWTWSYKNTNIKEVKIGNRAGFTGPLDLLGITNIIE